MPDAHAAGLRQFSKDCIIETAFVNPVSNPRCNQSGIVKSGFAGLKNFQDQQDVEMGCCRLNITPIEADCIAPHAAFHCMSVGRDMLESGDCLSSNASRVYADFYRLPVTSAATVAIDMTASFPGISRCMRCSSCEPVMVSGLPSIWSRHSVGSGFMRVSDLWAMPTKRINGELTILGAGSTRSSCRDTICL